MTYRGTLANEVIAWGTLMLCTDVTKVLEFLHERLSVKCCPTSEYRPANAA